jgi:hypothetical protein
MANLAIWRRKIRAEVVSTTHNNADQIKFEASLSELCLKFIRKWFLLLGSHTHEIHKKITYTALESLIIDNYHKARLKIFRY